MSKIKKKYCWECWKIINDIDLHYIDDPIGNSHAIHKTCYPEAKYSMRASIYEVIPNDKTKFQSATCNYKEV